MGGVGVVGECVGSGEYQCSWGRGSTRMEALVERCQFGFAAGAGADGVEDAYEYFVILAVDGLKMDALEISGAIGLGGKEKG